MDVRKKFKCRICGCTSYSRIEIGHYVEERDVIGSCSIVEIPYDNPYKKRPVYLHSCDGCSVVFVDKRMSDES